MKATIAWIVSCLTFLIVSGLGLYVFFGFAYSGHGIAGDGPYHPPPDMTRQGVVSLLVSFSAYFGIAVKWRCAVCSWILIPAIMISLITAVAAFSSNG